MNNIPKKLRSNMADDPFYRTCARADALDDHVCGADPLTGKMIEWEHALIHAGSQVQEKFAIVPLCYWAHRGEGFDKHINEWIALNRATQMELLDLSYKGGKDYFLYKAFLNKKFGVYNPVYKYRNTAGINYGFVVDNEPVIHI